MAINISENTTKAIQTLVHDAFDTNSILDRVKTVLTTVFACPIYANQVHMLAHKYSLDIADGVGDLIEVYNEPIDYGNILSHTEKYSSISEITDKLYNSVIIYQNELNEVAKIAFENMDIHIFNGLLKIIDKHNKYVEQVILWKDIVDKYKDNPNIDVYIKQYDILGE